MRRGHTSVTRWVRVVWLDRRKDATLIAAIYAVVVRHRAGVEAFDDFTLLVVRAR